MRPRLAVITEIIAPYRVPVFNALARSAAVDPHIIFLSETDPTLREWHIYADEIRFEYQVLPNWRRRFAGYNILLNYGLHQLLNRLSPDVLICGGYSYIASWQAAWWCAQREVPLVLWAESTGYDRRRRWPAVETLKKCFLQNCQACVVPGKSAFEYLSELKVPEPRIVTAPDAVDNDFFATSSELVRANADSYRSLHSLPDRYFLYVGRLVSSKGIFDVIDSYAALAPHLREQIGLVFAGNGRERGELQRRAEKIHPGRIKISGFLQREELAVYYALADMLVFPTRSDPWGLVVNEAMACGLPIITTSVAGCAADLVIHGENGLLVKAGCKPEITSAMNLLAQNAELRRRFGTRSAEKIRNNSPEACARGLVEAACLATRKVCYA